MNEQGHTPTFGLILAGGAARRMNGIDKPLAELSGKPLLAHAAERLAPQCAGLLISAHDAPERFASFGFPVVLDERDEHAGPLAGVLAGLEWVARHAPEIAFVATIPADTPFLPHDFVPRLHAARISAGAAVAIGESGGRAHPLAALWPLDIASALRAALEAGRLRAMDVVAGAARSVWAPDPLDPFFNVNTQGDLARARALMLAPPLEATDNG